MSSATHSVEAPSQRVEFRVQPNAALRGTSWRWFVAALVVVSLLIAGRFALLGYWMILPFTVLELSVLGFVMWLIFNRSNYVEKIVVDHESVVIEHIQKNHDKQWQFPVHWTRVKLESPAHRWYPHRLVLGSKGEWVEVGSCLTDLERKALAQAVDRQVQKSKDYKYA